MSKTVSVAGETVDPPEPPKEQEPKPSCTSKDSTSDRYTNMINNFLSNKCSPTKKICVCI